MFESEEFTLSFFKKYVHSLDGEKLNICLFIDLTMMICKLQYIDLIFINNR